MTQPNRREVLIAIGSALGAAATGGLTAFGRTPAHDSPAGTSLKVMSYNIAQGIGTDGKYDLQRIIDIIAAVDPDVVALQEVEDQNRASWRDESLTNYDAQHELIAQQLNMQHIIFAANRNWRNAEDMASWTEEEIRAGYRRRLGDVILSRKPIIEHTVYEYDANTRFNPPYQRVQGRNLTEALLDVDGERIWFYNTHLQPGSGETEFRRRSKQVQQLLEIASRRSGPRIFAGDFNFPDGRHNWRTEAFPTPRDYNAVTEQYTDVLHTLGADKPTAGIPPLRWGPVRLDYIFASDHFTIDAAETITYESEPEGPLPSDHRPICAELTIARDGD